ncbi:hypothetical protein [Holophaga foetida]|uniref:hypothetical protein n=1 Tax=Holophaga foetida TaxID=35839 RepID=UPI00047CF9D0|nr:hypothetical protein [Holophaga foetida]
MAKSYYAGMELDAPCGRCKGETRHRVMSVTDGVPEKLICMACKSVHKFRAERPSKAEPASRAVRTPRAGVAAAPIKPTAPSPNQFHQLMIEEQAGSQAKPYSIKERWEEGMWIDHPTFGLGKVQHRNAKKVDVLFKDGMKVLISG